MNVVPAKATEFKAMASEASNSRMFGGINYRSDCEQGLAVGKKVESFAVERAKVDGAN